MRIMDTEGAYGVVSVLIHWAMAVMIFAMAALGLYMTGLDYMDPWYTRAPDLHRSIGMAFFALAVVRVAWRILNGKPPAVEMPAWEAVTARLVHGLFYPLIVLIPISGYLISTADGRGVEFFDWITIPAIVYNIEGQEDMAGEAHLWVALFTVALACLHGAAALKHHFIERDATLVRMLGIARAGARMQTARRR